MQVKEQLYVGNKSSRKYQQEHYCEDPGVETFLEDWKNGKKASVSGRVRVGGSEVKEGTGASESDFDIH